MGDKREGKEYEEHTFHSSVNRIPRLPDDARKNDSASNEEIYREGIRTHLDYLHADRLSGYFDLQLISWSPLLIGEQTTEEGIHYLQVQEVDGKPFIAPTMIKGLLSTTYERITSSRFRIFDTPTHVKPLTYRTDPSQSLRLTPVRYAGESDDRQQLTFEILNEGQQGNIKLAYIPIWHNKKGTCRPIQSAKRCSKRAYRTIHARGKSTLQRLQNQAQMDSLFDFQNRR